MKKTPSPLKKIKSGAFSRGIALAKVTLSAGAKAATHAAEGLFASKDQNPDERLKALLLSQVELLTRELGQLKGSLMKVGQMLSMYGEKIFPPEVNELLKSLQDQSPPLEWPAIEKVLKRQLGPEKLALLEVDPVPYAAASLGQVHRAKRRSDGKEICLKIQYPGVDAAIESDLKAMKSILSVSKLIPKGPKYDDLFKEVRQMLYQEVDYQKELKHTQEVSERLRGDSRFRVPEIIEEFCTKRVLATSYEEGVSVDGPEVAGLSQDRRNAIAQAALDLYFKELFEWKSVQTDPHFGNYRIRLGKGPDQKDQLVLFDFGAVRKLEAKFTHSYFVMVRGSMKRDPELIEKGARGLGFLTDKDSPELIARFAELCLLFSEPFDPDLQPYAWAESDLPQRAMRAGKSLAFSFKLRPPPREIVFLDRKMGGLFIFLSVLKARFDAAHVLAKYLA